MRSIIRSLLFEDEYRLLRLLVLSYIIVEAAPAVPRSALPPSLVNGPSNDRENSFNCTNEPAGACLSSNLLKNPNFLASLLGLNVSFRDDDTEQRQNSLLALGLPEQSSSNEFDPLIFNLSCNRYPEFDFNTSSDPLAKPDLSKVQPLPGGSVDDVLGLNDSFCSNAGSNSFLVRPEAPYLRSYVVDDPRLNISTLVRAGVVWDPRPECANISGASIGSGVSFTGSGKPNLHCETIMTKITNNCNAADDRGKAGGTVFYKCAVFYWQPTLGTNAKRYDDQLFKRARLNPIPYGQPPPPDNDMFESETPEWRETYAKGRDRWRQLQNNLKAPKQPCFEDVSGWSVAQGRSDKFINIFDADCRKGGILKALDDTWNPGVSSETKVCSNTYYFLQQTFTEFFYKNWYSPSAGAIVAEGNYGRDGQDKAPLRWADVVHLYWALVCQSEGKPLSALRFAASSAVINTPTRNFVGSLIPPRGTRYEGKPMKPIMIDWTPVDADFYAVLGTVLGSGIVLLLGKYAGSFARWDRSPPHTVQAMKTIRSIKVIVRGGFGVEMAVIFEDIDPPFGNKPFPWDPTKILPIGISLPQ